MTDPSTPVPSDEALEAIADIIGPHLDIRHAWCGGTGSDPRSNLDCTGCGGTGYVVSGQPWRADDARKVARQVLTVAAPRIAAEAAAEARAARTVEVVAWLDSLHPEAPYALHLAEIRDLLLAHFNPEANPIPLPERTFLEANE